MEVNAMKQNNIHIIKINQGTSTHASIVALQGCIITN
jgi:hypothetical protein